MKFFFFLDFFSVIFYIIQSHFPPPQPMIFLLLNIYCDFFFTIIDTRQVSVYISPPQIIASAINILVVIII